MQVFEGQLQFGIHAGRQTTDFASYLAVWRKAGDLGLDGASVMDHFLRPDRRPRATKLEHEPGLDRGFFCSGGTHVRLCHWRL